MKHLTVSSLLVAGLFLGGCSQSSVNARSEAPVQLPADTRVDVRVDRDLDTAKVKQGDRFTATLDRELVQDGRTVVPKGTDFQGEITAASAAQSAGDTGKLGLTLKSFRVGVKTYQIETNPYYFQTSPMKTDPATLKQDKNIPASIPGQLQNAFVPKDSILTFALRQPVDLK